MPKALTSIRCLCATCPSERILLIACIIRKGKVIIPGGRDTIEIGDSVVVVTTKPFMKDIGDIFA